MLKVLWRMTIGLPRLLRTELKKKHKPKMWVEIGRRIVVSYWRVIYGYYKHYLKYATEKVYRTHVKKERNSQKIQNDLVRGVKLLRLIDVLMTQKSVSKQERKQFWHDFVKNEEVRKDTFDQLEAYVRRVRFK